MSVKELLSSYPVITEQTVIWGDMDAFQHVNNTVYFRYFETARIAYFDQVGIKGLMEETGVGPILAHTQCQFKIPLTYPDTISIGARVSELEDSKFSMEYRVVSHQHQKVAAQGSGLVVAFNYQTNQKVHVPKELRAAIEELQR